MKKFLSILAALVFCSTAAIAQEYMTFNPASDSKLDSLTSTITATITDYGKTAASGAVKALVQPVAGYGFGQEMKESFTCPITNSTITISLTKDMWALPFNEDYHIQLIVVLLDAEGTPIEDPAVGDFAMGFTAYICHDNGDAVWAKNYPNEVNWTEDGLTFESFYSIGKCTFYFTKEVTLPLGSIGTIIYTSAGKATSYQIVDKTTGWDDDLGLYAVTVDVRNDIYTVDNLESIKVSLIGVKDKTGKVITVTPILAENNPAVPQKAPRERKSVEIGLSSGNAAVNIYNIQGILVKEGVSAKEVNELPAGLYIVNGKKVFVR